MIIAGRKINRIVASGCSFTYGQGLDDPKTESWPAQLSKMFDVECVNLAKIGHGNEHVQDSIIDYIAKNPLHVSDSFIIPCFSTYSRIEFPLISPENTFTFATIMSSKTKPEFTQMFFRDFFCPKYYYRRYMRIIILLQESLKNRDILYLMFDGLGTNPHERFANDHDILQLDDQVDKSKWLGFKLKNIDNMTSPKDRLADGHPNKNAYAQTADILYQHIINTYATE